VAFVVVPPGNMASRDGQIILCQKESLWSQSNIGLVHLVIFQQNILEKANIIYK